MNAENATRKAAAGAGRARVKICGITNPADAWAAIACGADALGFNGYPGSKRFIDLRKAGEWIRELPPFVTRVAVLVNADRAEAEAIFDLPYIDWVQFHGNEEAAYCAWFAERNRSFIKAAPLKDADSLAGIEKYATRHILIDAHTAAGFGGTGELIDLGLAEKLTAARPEIRWILSGGLNPGNVSEAIRRVRPFAVDVASGVESAPGRKDAEKMRAFVESARG